MKTPVLATLVGGAAVAGAATVALLSSGPGVDAGRRAPVPASPSAARVEPLERRLGELEREVARLRAQLAAASPAPASPAAAAPLRAGAEPAEGAAAEPRASTAAAVSAGEPAAAGRLQPEAIAHVTRVQAALRFDSPDRDVREGAVAELVGLARQGDREALQLLVDGLESEDDRKRDDALEGLAELGDPAHFPLFEAAAREDPSGRVRAEAAEALKRMPADRAGPVLVDLLEDESEWVVRESIDSLGDLGYQRAAPELRRLAQSDDLGLAVRSARSLGQLGDASAVPLVLPRLAERAGDADPEVRRDALRGMRRLDAEEARPYFEQALQDESGRVRREAERGLRDLDGEDDGGRRRWG